MKTDLLIIGSGPAGLQAAIHASRRKVKVMVVGKISGSSLKKAKVENYCCMDLFSNGKDLLERGRRQCENFGVVFIEEDVLKVENKEDKSFYVEIANGKKIEARAIIIATGVTVAKLGVPGENKYHGKGVSYCVDCDAGFFKDKTVAVIGNGSAAISGAMFLTLYAKDVYLIAKYLDINENLKSQINSSKIVQINNQWVEAILGTENKVTNLILENDEKLEVDGIFIELGAKGAVELFNPLGVILDKEKFSYIDVNKKQETNISGIFAAGDICGQPFQLAKAVGEGCVAGISASNYLKANKIK